MLDIVCRKFKSKVVVNELISSKSAITQKLRHNFVNTWHNHFYISHENKLRSLNVYYSHNVMGKQKYRSIRKANRNSIFQKHKMGNYVPYSDLAKYIAGLDIGEIKHLCPNLVGFQEVQDTPVGIYRELRDYIPRLAEFYIKVNHHRSDKLLTFNNFTKKDPSSILFLIAFGGDGAPGVGTVFSVSFINVGKRLLSSSETFMVFGGDVQEGSLAARRFVVKATADLIYLESQVFH